jgi:hypothetical protein
MTIEGVGGINMPYPSKGESKETYIARCIPYMIKEGKKQDQAVAMCHAFWEEYGPGKKESKTVRKIDKYLKEEEEKAKKFTTEQAKEIGEKLGIDWSKYDVEQFRMGLDVELEHGTVSPHTNVTDDDPIKTGKIALAHLNESVNYYTLLAEMEKKATKNDSPVE